MKQAHDPTGMDHSSVKMSFPVDLNQLFTLSYSFDALKSALDFMHNNQSQHDEILTRL
jgi:hypothetical protein